MTAEVYHEQSWDLLVQKTVQTNRVIFSCLNIMDEVDCEKAIEIFTNEQLLVQMTGYGLVVDVLEQRRESNGLVNGFSTQLELVVGAYDAELAWGFDHETYGKLTFIVLIFYTSFNHASSGKKMAHILIIIGIDVFMKDFQPNF